MNSFKTVLHSKTIFLIFIVIFFSATTAELVDEAPSPSGSLPECEQIKRVHESNFDNPVFDGSETKSDNFDDLEVL